MEYTNIQIFKSKYSILIFDSGVGGLSVYDEMRQLMPDFHYIYVFDNIAFPYGEKSKEFIIKRVLEIITVVQYQYPLALAIIACNTASTASLPVLRKKLSFPVIGVLPIIKPAIYLTINKVIGLLATRRTLRSSYTHKLITYFAKEYQIKTLELTELVELAEAKMCGETISLKDLRRILQPWLCIPKPPDTIVLGCTHFSLLREELISTLPSGTNLVDSSTAIIHHVTLLLQHKTLNIKLNKPNNAFCMTLNKKAVRLLPILNRYGFKTLEELVL